MNLLRRVHTVLANAVKISGYLFHPLDPRSIYFILE
jgi:hypothetical protein